MFGLDVERTPGFKFLLAIVVAMALTAPLFSIWLLVYDRKAQSREATASITQGWGAAQVISGPMLVIPYRTWVTQSLVQNGQNVTRSNQVTRELVLAPEAAQLTTEINPKVRKRSIYEAVVYDARNKGQARFAFPADLARSGVTPSQMELGRAELRFEFSDPRGVGANAQITANGQLLRLEPGAGSSGARGFFALVDARGLGAKPLNVDFAFDLRGNRSLSLAARAGDTRWTVRSSWTSPSFAGDFLPGDRHVGDGGFKANYRIGNLALGRSLVSTRDSGGQASQPQPDLAQTAQISLIQPVDPYSQVNRATKYGFLFIGFTFLALLLFDLIGGARVSAVEYLLMGAALVLFFVLLLAFAEVMGFTAAYILASGAIAGLNTAYCAAILESWRRAGFIGALLAGLYALLYVLLSLEAYSLLIGALLLFVALAGLMYLTRRIDWGSRREAFTAG